MNLRTFQFFPGGRAMEESWFVLCLASFACLYPIFKSNADWTFSRLELYLLGVVALLIVLPALSAYHVFGQPLFYGVLARRSTILLTTWLLFIHAWRYGWVDEEDVQAALLFLVWFVFVLFTAMRVFLNPNTYPNAPIGFILGFGTDTMAFAVPGYFLPFGVVYYALRGIREQRTRFYLYAAALFLDGAGSSWRSLLVSLSLTILFFLFRWRRIEQVALALAKFAIVILLTAGLLRFVKPGFVSEAVGHFAAAVQVAVGGSKEGLDPSADARVEQINTALPYVRQYPIFGAGELSGQWQSGPSAVLGSYFSDTDIGLIGMMFTFGLVGILFSAGQYVFGIQAALRSKGMQSPLLDAAKGYTLFTVFLSISTGFFIVSFEVTSFFIVLLMLMTESRVGAPQGAPSAGDDKAGFGHMPNAGSRLPLRTA